MGASGFGTSAGVQSRIAHTHWPTPSSNRRRAVDCVPREFVAELLSHAERHGQTYVKDAVEYAIGTIAAAAFGAILYSVVTGDSIVGALTNIINRALTTRV